MCVCVWMTDSGGAGYDASRVRSITCRGVMENDKISGWTNLELVSRCVSYEEKT